MKLNTNLVLSINIQGRLYKLTYNLNCHHKVTIQIVTTTITMTIKIKNLTN